MSHEPHCFMISRCSLGSISSFGRSSSGAAWKISSRRYMPGCSALRMRDILVLQLCSIFATSSSESSRSESRHANNSQNQSRRDVLFVFHPHLDTAMLCFRTTHTTVRLRLVSPSGRSCVHSSSTSDATLVCGVSYCTCDSQRTIHD